MDSITITPSLLGTRIDHMTAPLGTWEDSNVCLRIRIAITATTGSQSMSALLIADVDTGDDEFAKAAYRDVGRGGVVNVGINPINLEVYPNPSHPNARIMYTVIEEDAGDMTEVRVFDMSGRDIATLVHDVQSAGRHSVEFNGTGLRSGEYCIAIHCQNHMASTMVVVTR